MQTLYIDVYFLINFSVNLLALYFSVKLLHIRCGVPRLLLCAFIGALCAITDIFLTDGVAKLFCAVIALLLIGIFISGKMSLSRRGKLIILFLLCEVILGGLVYFGYSLLDRVLGEELTETDGSENRGALIFSVIILLSIGVFKFLFMMFSGFRKERFVKLKIKVCEKEIEAEAFLDSGNLVQDSMSMCPVLFIKPTLAKKLLPKNIIELTKLDELPEAYRKKLRFIPVCRSGQTHIVTGVRPDSVSVILEGSEEQVDFTVAIDKEGGTFGGYEVLAPSSALDNVL